MVSFQYSSEVKVCSGEADVRPLTIEEIDAIAGGSRL